jgi:multiple sugar transport system permease protein
MPARTVGRIVSYIVLVLIGLVALAPFVFLLIISFKSRIEVLEVPPSLHFSTAQIRENYSQVINDKGFLTFIKNSVIVTGISTLIALGLGVPAGSAFSLPLVVWIMIGFFDEIPREIDDAALVDGCSRASALFRVLLPLARPGMMVAATFGVIFIWNEFLVGLYIVNSSSRETIPIAASALLTVESPIDWNLAAATGILTVIPVLLFSLFVQRYIVRGITAGAVR